MQATATSINVVTAKSVWFGWSWRRDQRSQLKRILRIFNYFPGKRKLVSIFSKKVRNCLWTDLNHQKVFAPSISAWDKQFLCWRWTRIIFKFPQITVCSININHWLINYENQSKMLSSKIVDLQWDFSAHVYQSLLTRDKVSHVGIFNPALWTVASITISLVQLSRTTHFHVSKYCKHRVCGWEGVGGVESCWKPYSAEV